MVLGGCHGSDPKAVFANLCEIVAEALELYAKNGRPLPPADSNYDWPIEKQSATTTRINASIIKNEWAQGILKKSGDGAQFVRFKDGSENSTETYWSNK